jgi:hypothetical protein
LPTPFDQQGKVRLAPVGREVMFGSCIYTFDHSDQPDSSMEGHYCVALCQQGTERERRWFVV